MPIEQIFSHSTGRWRVPDRVFRVFAVLVSLLTWALLLIAYPMLPNTIPAHFSWSGAVDATTAKTWWSVFMPGILQVGLTMIFWWLSDHPEYSNLPTRVRLTAVAEPIQSTLRRLLSHMLVMVNVLINCIFASVAVAIVQAGLGKTSMFQSWSILGLVSLVILLASVYSIVMARILQRSTGAK